MKFIIIILIYFKNVLLLTSHVILNREHGPIHQSKRPDRIVSSVHTHNVY